MLFRIHGFRQPQQGSGVMFRSFLISCSSVLFVLSLGVGCSERQAAALSDAPAAPEMPANWKVTSDFLAPSGQLGSFSEKLGGEIEHLRNTNYSVNGKSVQVNTIVARDASSADKIMASILKIKSEQAILRVGLTIYEFVGKNDVLPLIGAGKAHLQANGAGN
jgi:hypothetical protein